MDMTHLADLCLVGLVLAYSLNLAPMMFESFTSDRIWASNPPDSFHMFLGKYGTLVRFLGTCCTPAPIDGYF